MSDEIVSYPIILTEYNDEDGHYFTGTSPNLQGMVAEGSSITNVILDAKDAAALLLCDMPYYPKVMNPYKWKLKKNQHITWLTINMSRWKSKYDDKIIKKVKIPIDLADWAKKKNISLSKLICQKLYAMRFSRKDKVDY